MPNYNYVEPSLADAYISTYSSYKYTFAGMPTGTSASATAFVGGHPIITYPMWKTQHNGPDSYVVVINEIDRTTSKDSTDKKLTERELDDLVDFDVSDPPTTDMTIATETDLDESIIDEREITDFHRGTVNNPFLFNATKAELEKFLLTCVFVAGKNATVQQKKLDQFVECVRRDLGSYSTDNLGVISTIYNALSKEDVPLRVDEWLREAKVGQYSRIGGCIVSLCDKIGSGKISTTGCNRGNLSAIKGIGLKTASFYLLYTRKNWGGACLDTHILRWMREELSLPNIPDVTPHTKEEYIRIENIFLQQAAKLNKSIPDLDFEIWSKYRK